jgi:putative ABC transport system permease protein
MELPMLKNYIKIAFRNLVHYKSYTLINMLGLAVGIAATILILLYIQFELSFDNFHTNADNLYRISIIHKHKDVIEYDSHQFTAPIGLMMKKDFPEVENFARISFLRSSYLKSDNRIQKVNGLRHADPSLLEIFTFPVVEGNQTNMLTDPFSLVLTQPTAERLFGEENAIGKMVEMDDGDLYKITGIVESPPENSHIRFNALISFSTLYNQSGWYMDWNGGNQFTTYIKLIEGVNHSVVNEKFPDFLWLYINKDFKNIGVELEAYLQPLRDIHLFYSDSNSLGILKIIVLTSIALLILIMACINYINLGTARSGIRAKEVGIRKVLGAGKTTLIRQFLVESIIVTTFSLVLAILLVELFHPIYNDVIGYNLKLLDSLDPIQISSLLLIIITVGLVSGGYPAFYLSSIEPIKSLKGVFKTGKIKTRARNTLVVIQFLVSIILIIITIAVNAQLSFVRSKELGFNKEQILVLPLPGEEVQTKSSILKDELKRLPGIMNAAASSEVPILNFTSNGYIPEGHETPMMIHVIDVDEDFLNTFDIQLIQGRNFSNEFTTDKSTYLINESLVNSLGWDAPLGKDIERNGNHQVIGVVKDFHYATFYNKIEPLIITNSPWKNKFRNLSLKIYPKGISETLASVKSKWEKLIPDKPFEFWFLSESFDNLYKMEQKFEKIFFYFSLIALAIALLGLYSLVSFSTVQRTKEIGIRKILGASTLKILKLLSIEYLGLVVIANIIAWPIAWLILNKLLQHFAYKVDIGFAVFIFAGALAFIIAFITISSQTIKAALSSPIEALRYE